MRPSGRARYPRARRYHMTRGRRRGPSHASTGIRYSRHRAARERADGTVRPDSHSDTRDGATRHLAATSTVAVRVSTEASARWPYDDGVTAAIRHPAAPSGACAHAALRQTPATQTRAHSPRTTQLTRSTRRGSTGCIAPRDHAPAHRSTRGRGAHSTCSPPPHVHCGVRVKHLGHVLRRVGRHPR